MPSTLQTFSQSLLRLASLAREYSLEQFLPAAVGTVQSQVGFRSAWWGWVSDPEADGAPPRVHLHGSVGLAAGFAEEWAAVAGSDVFARTSVNAPGNVMRFSADARASPVRPVEHFAVRHDLFHTMALTAPDPASGMMFFIAAYCGIADPPFSQRDAILFGEFAQHLLQLTQQNLREALALASDVHAADVGLISSQGNPVFLGYALWRQMEQEWPNWDGNTLPVDLLRQFGDVPCAMRLGTGTLEIRAQGDRFLIRSISGLPAPLLAPRERRVALLYATGRSHKEIAQILSLSPATVRTYLRDCYLRLGVSNRTALTSALDKAAIRARPAVGSGSG